MGPASPTGTGSSLGAAMSERASTASRGRETSSRRCQSPFMSGTWTLLPLNATCQTPPCRPERRALPWARRATSARGAPRFAERSPRRGSRARSAAPLARASTPSRGSPCFAATRAIASRLSGIEPWRWPTLTASSSRRHRSARSQNRRDSSRTPRSSQISPTRVARDHLPDADTRAARHLGALGEDRDGGVHVPVGALRRWRRYTVQNIPGHASRASGWRRTIASPASARATADFTSPLM